MFDVFYIGNKPNLFVHEREAKSIQHAQSLSRTRFCWIVNYLSDYSNFDFLWEPVPWQREFTHVWPSQWHEYSGTYLVPRTGEIKYHFQQDVVPNRVEMNNFRVNVAESQFDFSWAPHPMDPPYIYVFGNQWHRGEIMPTVEYHVPGASERKYLTVPKARLLPAWHQRWKALMPCTWDTTWQPDPGDPPYIYVFGNQWYRAEVMPTLEYHVPGATERKYVRYPQAQLLPDKTHWVIPNDIDPNSVDYTWRPDPGSPPYIYQFGTQHQKTGGPEYHVPGATEIKYIRQITAKTSSKASAVIEIDHLDGHVGKIPGTIKTSRYFDNYLDTLKRIAKTVPEEHEFVWICSSICDYSKFDFSWHPEQWQATMLHVFSSDGEKFGDTFFMHVPSFRINSERCQLLDWYDLNFVEDISVPRWPLPVIRHQDQTQVSAIKRESWAGPLAVFATRDVNVDLPCVPLWREKTKTVVPLSTSADVVIVPKVAVPYIKTQVYDYEHIDKTQKHRVKPHYQDIVFISYDEPDADKNWETLQKKFPRARRVHGVKGMETALEAAADISTTPWYFAVFAKTEIAETFDFSFVPDYMQQPKHYIFNCRNMVNGLEYGHMGIVMYNSDGIRQLNQTRDFGIDYTLSFPHESVPLLSCYGRFDQSAYHTWRTAFRESAKLAYFEHSNPTVEGAYRLNVWLTVAQGPYAEWCIRGAENGVEFFQSTQGQLDILKQSFRWEWLRTYFVNRYGDLD